MNKVDIVDLAEALMNAVKDITDIMDCTFESRMMTSLIDKEIQYNDYDRFACYTKIVNI